MNLKFSKWSSMQRNVIGITLILIIWLVWSSFMETTQITTGFFTILIIITLFWNTFIGMDDDTRKIVNLPDGKLEIENDDEKFEIDVKMGSSSISFANVEPKIIQETTIYYASRFLSSATRKIKEINAPLEIALFNREGEIVRIEEIPAETEKEIKIGDDVQHIIMAHEGFFAENNISVDNNSKII